MHQLAKKVVSLPEGVIRSLMSVKKEPEPAEENKHLVPVTLSYREVYGQDPVYLKPIALVLHCTSHASVLLEDPVPSKMEQLIGSWKRGVLALLSSTK